MGMCEIGGVSQLWLVIIANSHFIAFEYDLGFLLISIATPELLQNSQSLWVIEAMKWSG